MAHNTYTRPGGAWTDGVDTITEADLESFELKMYKAINGDDGGTWAPAAAIIIGGSGVNLASSSNVMSGIMSQTGTHNVESAATVAFKAGSLLKYYGTVVPQFDAARNYTRVCQASPMPEDATDWTMGPGYCKTITTDLSALTFPLELPHGSTLVWASVSFIGAMTGAMPTFMPTAKVYKTHRTTGVSTQIGSTYTDPSLNEAAFEVDHPLEVTGLSEVVDRATYTYSIQLTTPNGGGTSVGAYFRAPTVNFNLTVPDVAAA